MRQIAFLCAFSVAAIAVNAAAQQAVPDISGYWSRGQPVHSAFRPPENGGPGPVINMNPPPPEAGGGFAMIWEGDHTNPILQPWAASIVQENTVTALADNPPLSAQQSCRPHGVPYILQLNDTVQFLQSPEITTILFSREMRARLIYMNVGHPADWEPTYYGHSVGHWEGDTLVVDTVGLTDDTWTDRFGTPHTDKLHVIERYRKVSDDEIRVDFTVMDPGAFTTPWSAWVTYHPEDNLYLEQVCAENNRDPVTDTEYPIPRDETPDF
ncbi:MAG: hypothetical protein RJB62_1874 [Pseudomonadota bacterium]|jgi:hypothetical protein